MSEVAEVLSGMRKMAEGQKPEVIRNHIHLEHRLADLIYGNKDSDEANFIVDKSDLDRVINSIKQGKKIFKTPELKNADFVTEYMKSDRCTAHSVTLANPKRIKPNLLAIAQGKPAPTAQAIKKIINQNQT